MGMKNDVSFLISDTMNIYEQQSSYNPNMPLRFLFYASMIYSGYVSTNQLCLYDSYIEYIPAPRCICFYNGEYEMGEKVELRLSDAFKNGNKGDIEITVTMLNVNYGKNKELMEKCEPLEEFSWFVNETRKKNKEGMSIKEAVNEALDDMPSNYLIRPFLFRNREEVETMCITEYNKAKTYELYGAKCEARGKAEGMIETIIGFFKDGLISEKDAAKRANMSLEDFRKAEVLYCN